MNDSADIKMAVDRLQDALQKLEGSLEPLLSRAQKMEKIVNEAEDFARDRAALAHQLDLSKAREKDFEAREGEFSILASETTTELDRVIHQVKVALGRSGGSLPKEGGE